MSAAPTTSMAADSTSPSTQHPRALRPVLESRETPDTHRRQSEAARLNAIKVPPGSFPPGQALEFLALTRLKNRLLADWDDIRQWYAELKEDYEYLVECSQTGEEWEPQTFHVQCLVLKTSSDDVDEGMVAVEENGEGVERALEKAEEEWLIRVERLADVDRRARRCGIN